MVTSSSDMNPTTRVTARARQRRGSGSWGGDSVTHQVYPDSPRSSRGKDVGRVVQRGGRPDREIGRRQSPTRIAAIVLSALRWSPSVPGHTDLVDRARKPMTSLAGTFMSV